jgi:hypothetical protein
MPMKQRRRRKCLHCGELFRPDPRNLRHQRYCSELACRRAGKAASQRRWLSKAANRDYFHGPENVERVRAWRARNPGYWRAARLSAKALQEHSLAQVTENHQQSAALAAPALQELSIAQPLVLMGLIAHFTGAALQEDIAISARRFRQLAQDILGTSADPLSTQAPPLG